MRRAAKSLGLAGLLGALVLAWACGGSPAASGQGPAAAARAQETAPPASSNGRIRRSARVPACGQSGGDWSAQRGHRGRTAGAGIHRRAVAGVRLHGRAACRLRRAATPVGDVNMKNIVAKIPGTSPDIVMFTTHYDSKRIPNFVGADDGGSSSGVMLELARSLCARKNALTVWITFFDGEEAFNRDWADPDHTYGSREMAARMALSGELRRVRAFVLADLVGNRKLRLKRESQSTPWLTDLIWATAARLGYQRTFVNESTPIEDDHLAFVNRGVAAADIIDLEIAAERQLLAQYVRHARQGQPAKPGHCGACIELSSCHNWRESSSQGRIAKTLPPGPPSSALQQARVC